MIKYWNSRSSYPLQSYHIEVLALRIFQTGMDNVVWEVRQFFEDAASLVSGSLVHDGAIVDDYLSWESRQKALAALESALSLANIAWFQWKHPQNDRESIRYWRQIFGSAFPQYGY